jgi:hypothetical protein
LQKKGDGKVIETLDIKRRERNETLKPVILKQSSGKPNALQKRKQNIQQSHETTKNIQKVREREQNIASVKSI